MSTDSATLTAQSRPSPRCLDAAAAAHFAAIRRARKLRGDLQHSLQFGQTLSKTQATNLLRISRLSGAFWFKRSAINQSFDFRHDFNWQCTERQRSGDALDLLFCPGTRDRNGCFGLAP